MSCMNCIGKDWCICQSVKLIYNKTRFNNNCLCCYERIRVVDEFSRNTKASIRQNMKRKSMGILEYYKDVILKDKTEQRK